ncbi:MAG: nuclear transport factor 2 family protein [Betaproteobacteria bacterium]|nr:MAG: nuclear transport factor 2 family protein [Betaproteobacteria bacterium]
MRHLLLGLTLLVTAGDRTANRDALLAADRALSDKTASLGMVQGFVPVLDHGAAYLYPGAPLLRGSDHIRSFLESTDSIVQQTWAPVFADVSADGRLGYSYGWTRSSGARGKYLACWQKTHDGWRLAAFASSRPVPVPDSVALPPSQPGNGALSAQVRGRADSRELMQADSSFAALSAASGAKTAFLAFAAEDAISFGAGAQLTAGRAAIGASFDGFPAGAVLEWWPVAAQIAPSGDLGCTVGEARISTLHHYSKYLTIWRRQPDRSWKFVADGGNVRPAP